MTDEHVLVNRASWDNDAPNWVERGRVSWAGEPSWGIWGVPETELGLLPDLEGLDAVEIGCGTGYISAWIARRGARPVAIDNSGQQLATAKMLQDEFDLLSRSSTAMPMSDADVTWEWARRWPSVEAWKARKED